ALASYTGWNDVGLTGQFYRGLPDHLKDMFQYIPHPQTFADMCWTALDFDQRHWECQEEAGRTQKSISDKPDSGRKAGNDTKSISAPSNTSPIRNIASSTPSASHSTTNTINLPHFQPNPITSTKV